MNTPIGIPVLGTAIVNGVSWLERLIQSIDYPVHNFVVFNNNGRGEITEQLDALKSKPHPYISNFYVCHLPHNIGCAGAWNMIIKSFITAPYWIICNHDLEFGNGLLESMVSKAASDNEVGMVHCNASGPYVGDDITYNIGSFELILIKDWVVQQYGLFDENIYPAYCEDVDYVMRIVNKPFKRLVTNIPYKHGEDSYASTGSQTWRTEPSVKDRIDQAHRLIVEYILNKWGCFWDETWSNMTPIKGAYIPYNIQFNRTKHLGF